MKIEIDQNDSSLFAFLLGISSAYIYQERKRSPEVFEQVEDLCSRIIHQILEQLGSEGI